jgi:NADPH:quinone reductase-like Zn-dependent oxidoreductase
MAPCCDHGRQARLNHAFAHAGVTVTSATLRRATRATATSSRVPLAGASRGWRSRHPDWFREDFLVLLKLLRADTIHPVVAERLPLAAARRAHELLEQSASVGKLVLVP